MRVMMVLASTSAQDTAPAGGCPWQASCSSDCADAHTVPFSTARLCGTTRFGCLWADEDDMLETVCSITASSIQPSYCARERACSPSSTCRTRVPSLSSAWPSDGNGSGDQPIMPFVSGRSQPGSWITWQAARERHNRETGMVLSEE